MCKTELFKWFDAVTDISPIFSHLGKISQVVNDNNIPFAAVRWNKELKGIDFIINPESFSHLLDIEKQFVICHEAMHILFGHLEYWISGQYDQHKMNIATDVLINESLFTHFGFQREALPNLEHICTFDTVFTPEQIHTFKLSLSSTWKEIYAALESHQNINEYETLDNHINTGKTSENLDNDNMKESKSGTESPDSLDADPQSLDNPDKKGKISLEISFEECFNMQNLIRGEKREHKETIDTPYTEISEKVRRTLGLKMFQNDKQHKWERLLSFVEPSRFSADRGEKQTFAIPNTVIGHIVKRQNLRLPARVCMPMPKKNKIRLYFFWDISPSCLHYKEWFEDIVTHIPPNRFDVSVYAFDVSCHRLQLDYGTGLISQEIESLQGTDFNCLQKQIERDLNTQEILFYPDMVCVLTDGMARKVENIPEQYRNRWLWLITGIDEQERENSFELSFVNLARNIIKKNIIPIRDDYDVFNPQISKGDLFCKMMPAYILD